MRQPVITRCGHTFDLHAIDQWLQRGHNTCPECRAPCLARPFVPNFVARSLVAIRAPPDTVGPVDDGVAGRRRPGTLLVTVRFKESLVGVILKPTTKLYRLLRACRVRFGVDVDVVFGGSTIHDDRTTTARSLGLVDGSVLMAHVMGESFFV